jgi:hypothetical protein
MESKTGSPWYDRKAIRVWVCQYSSHDHGAGLDIGGSFLMGEDVTLDDGGGGET